MIRVDLRRRHYRHSEEGRLRTNNLMSDLMSDIRMVGGNHFITIETIATHCTWAWDMDTKDLLDDSDWPPIAKLRRTK